MSREGDSYFNSIQLFLLCFENTYRFKAALQKMHVSILQFRVIWDHANSPFWPTKRCLVWKWLLCDFFVNV